VQQLRDVVLDAFDAIASRLVGETPDGPLLWDTRSRRPKSEDEVSDYLLNRLKDLVGGRGVVINREVQVRRARVGVGERLDLRVDAISDDPSAAAISLPIEVKGAWNRELLTSLPAQLADRYMRDLAAAEGLYVVVWPDVAVWDEDDQAAQPWRGSTAPPSRSSSTLKPLAWGKGGTCPS